MNRKKKVYNRSTPTDDQGLQKTIINVFKKAE